ncbi:hypothetical protein BV20DRAFT_138226 [Pilatotrama ljubarskyi]|nr:hypothetical protein BV20DRAFT_138226 [Pilatotrama ljubarskyi]
MQSPVLHRSPHAYPYSPGTTVSGGRLDSAGYYDSSRLGYVGSRDYQQPSSADSFPPRIAVQHNQFSAATTVQQSYHPGHLQGYIQASLPSDAHASSFETNTWPSSTPSPPAISDSSGVRSAYCAVSATSRSTMQPRHAQYHSAYAAYQARTSSAAPNHQTTPSESYNNAYAGAPPSAFRDNSGYATTGHNSASLGYAAQSAYDARPQAMATPRCEWGDSLCGMPIEDSSPSGIARHLKQYHNIQVTDNRSRHSCLWGSRRCGKDMYPSSFGKHIAECHLRNMVKRCPHCGADFARADTLSRHIKAFCPNSSG